MLLPVGRAPLAIVAGYLGLLSLIPFVGLIAITSGLLAVRQIKKNPGQCGMGRAVFGVVGGFLGTAFWIVLVVVGA